jgi:RimJ/RimL family protein N-acetyltransferase
MEHPSLVGNLIYLRPMQRSEADHYLDWLNDQDVIRTLGRPYFPLTHEAEMKFYDSILSGNRDNVLLAIARHEDDRHIGSCGLHNIDWVGRKAELGILIGDKTCWNLGYGTEAVKLLTDYGFRWLNLNRVYLHVHRDNVGGIKAYCKAGFTEEGCMREDCYRDGEYVDSLVMGILRAEWQVKALPKLDFSPAES